MDLGSGDGRTVIAAAKRGARATGIEYNPDMVKLSRRNAEKAGVSDRARFENADLFKTDLSKASVITMFLLTDINLRLRPTILRAEAGNARGLQHVPDGRLGARTRRRSSAATRIAPRICGSCRRAWTASGRPARAISC